MNEVNRRVSRLTQLIQIQEAVSYSHDPTSAVSRPVLLKQRTKSYDEIPHQNFKDLGSIYDELRL